MISVKAWKNKCKKKKKRNLQEIKSILMRLWNTFGASHVNYCKYHWLILAVSFTSQHRQRAARCLQRLIQQVASVEGRMQNLSFDVQPSETARWDWVVKLHSRTGFSFSSATAFLSILQNAKLILIKEVQLFILLFLLFCFWISTGFDCLNQIYSVSCKEKGATVLFKSAEQLSKKIVWYFSLLVLHHWIVGVFTLKKSVSFK